MAPRQQRTRTAAALLAAAASLVSAQQNNTSTTGGGSTSGAGATVAAVNGTAKGNTWAVVGAPQVSAQQLYRGQGNKVGAVTGGGKASDCLYAVHC
jgi:hypothetical protein